MVSGNKKITKNFVGIRDGEGRGILIWLKPEVLDNNGG